jgi:integrase
LVKGHSNEDEIFKKGRASDPYNAWTRKVNRFLKDNGGYTTHDFRRTTATNIYRDTKNILIVSKLLGHRNV